MENSRWHQQTHIFNIQGSKYSILDVHSSLLKHNVGCSNGSEIPTLTEVVTLEIDVCTTSAWQIVGIPMGTNCVLFVADLFLFCYERDLMLSLSDNNQSDVIEAFNSTSRYLDDLLNIDNPYFEQMVGQIYPTELQLNKANSSDTEAPFLDLNLSITNGIVSSKIYDKRDDFNFQIVNFPFLDGDVPHSPSYGVYISQLIRFARVCSGVHYFNNC